ncbi:MAG TPA: amino acid--tRNA ligase-related protein, partial [Candidatus Elarobacter sp.]|nr:amino acid--tRNA ligase-related protein [Candidatus Elarobacter sp.]
MADLVAARRARLAALRERGVDPFAATRFDVTAHVAELATRYAELPEQGRAESESWSIAGRIMAVRGQGGVIFFDLNDRTGRFQLFVRKNDVGDEAFAIAKELERGDIAGASGFVFRTKAGDLALYVRSFEVLGKSLQPLPDKWHGLQDVEKRYRRRYVDLIVNPHVRDVMILRSRIVAEMRRFIDAQGFFEVETPTLLTIAGGASARPFRTHSNALDIPLDLRIATELNLKRLIVGGMERVYEIGRIFRNEGIDATHNPEFTMLELYAAFWDVGDMMRFNEDLMAHLARTVHGSETVMHGEDAISFATPFRRIGYLEAFKEFGGLEREQLLDPGACLMLLRDFGIP